MRLVSRTIDVLRLLAQTPDGVGVTMLAEQLGELPSTVHRLLAALLEHDYVAQTRDRRYRLGVGVLGLAHAFQRQDRLVSMAGAGRRTPAWTRRMNAHVIARTVPRPPA